MVHSMIVAKKTLGFTISDVLFTKMIVSVSMLQLRLGRRKAPSLDLTKLNLKL